jgi:DNA-directed RNA polymerase specialized sigma24 family protein
MRTVLESIDRRKLLADDRPTVSRFVDGLEALTLRIARSQYRMASREAEDILLEVLRRLWDDDRAALRAWRGDGSLERHLRAIVHRACLMELRRRKRRPAEHGTDLLDTFPAEPAPMPV